MAKWLMGLTIADAARNPGSVHHEKLGLTESDTPAFCSFSWLIHTRLRAAVFINLVRMRNAISLKNDNSHCTLTSENLRKLQQANYLYHSALNGF